MTKVWIVACSLALVSAAGFSQAPSTAPNYLAEILSSSVANGSYDVRQSEEPFIGPLWRIEKSACTANASCGPYFPNLSCQGTTSCTAMDRQCPSVGFVTCNGVTTSCPACTPQEYCDACTATGSCYQCCRCNGGSGPDCKAECSVG